MRLHKCIQMVAIVAYYMSFLDNKLNVTHMYSLSENNIEDAGVQALAECFQHYIHLQKL